MFKWKQFNVLKSFIEKENARLALKAVKVIMNAIFILDVLFLNEHSWIACFVWAEFAIRDPHVTVLNVRLLSMMKINRSIDVSFDTMEKKIS